MISPVTFHFKSRSRRRISTVVKFLFSLTVLFTVLFFSVQHDDGVSTIIDQGRTALKGDWAIWRGMTGGMTGEELWLANMDDVTASHENDMGGEAECEYWDPERDEVDDPVGCLKARQYRQTQRVLEREEKAEHPHWYFTRDHNRTTLRKLLKCFLPLSHAEYTVCPHKPLILSGWWYSAEVITKATTGEVIWQTGLMKQVEALDLHFIAVGPYENWVTVAEMMPDVYRLIWNSDIETVSCLTDPRCIAADHYVPPVNSTDLSIGVPLEERGVIPIWALNVVDYWGCQPLDISNNDHWWGLTEYGDWSYHPLGQEWIATPWPLPGAHVHLPYSMEDQCLKLDYKPHHERDNSVLIFAKRSAYFDYHYVPSKQFWTDLNSDPTFDLFTTAKIEDGHPLPDGLKTLGVKTKDEYQALVGNVKALLGIGAPLISPSVYSALCQGTPVIVPYFTENARTDWWYLYSRSFQHGPAQMIGEPYVYSYYAKNYTQLSEVVHRALETTIERYIPPEMNFEYGLEQMRRYIARDLKGMFRDVLKQNGGKVPRLQARARERCLEINRCKPAFPAGKIPAMSRVKGKREVPAGP